MRVEWKLGGEVLDIYYRGSEVLDIGYFPRGKGG